MNKIFVIFFMLFFVVNCKNKPSHNYNLMGKNELQKETHDLKMLQDSFNTTGNYNYMKSYMIKINYLIKKYPNYKGFKQTKEMMLEMFGDSLHLETDTVNKMNIKTK